MKRRFLMVSIILAAAAAGAACKKKEQPAAVVVTPPPVVAPQAEKGAAVFGAKCAGCHRINGTGGSMGTDLSHVGARHDAVFLQTLLQNPATYYPKGVNMPAFGEMPKNDMDALITYLLTLK